MTRYFNFLYILGPIDEVDENVLVENLPSAEVQNLPDLGDIIGFENFLQTDGPISLKNRNFYQKCSHCKGKSIFSDYITKLSFTFDKKFVLSVFIFCITGILIMNV